MYLKSIEVHGFKSFANKILFEFHKGITGIVGPNGSGKSNVADAVRWVLGEQSAKQLRGAKMEDVIFSGTENRKPLGFAYVALTIDNSDHQLAIAYDTVTISRRVYRSGESEYQVNGTVCRLRDVNELFYDTGIGKEGYSIIGQGQIERILSGKPEERRELFDEAAGIVRFKRRKAEAIRKLETEKQNLIRVRDILSELEKQVEPLEKQAKAAKEYLYLKEELKRQEINVFLLESRSVYKQIEELEKKCEIVKGDLKTFQKTKEESRLEYEESEQKLQRQHQEAEGLQEAISDLQMRAKRSEGEILLLKEQIHSIRLQEKNMLLRIEQIGRELEERDQEKKKYLEEKRAVAALLDETERKQKQAQEKQKDLSEQGNELLLQAEKSRNQVIVLLNEKATIKTKIQRYETMLEQLQLRKAGVSSKMLQFKSQEQIQEEAMLTCKKKLDQIKTVIAELEEKNQCYTKESAKLQNQKADLENRKNQVQQQFHIIHSRLEALKGLTERYEGYGSSIRRVMELRGSQKGIIGVVADLIKAEKRYETAIETALGGSIQNIVTDGEQTAKELIAYLKKNRYGRATFLPLDGIGNSAVFSNVAVFRESGVIGLASELIEIEKKYQDVARNLLGRVIVVDQMDHALALARKFQYTLRIVTLDGELLNIGGTMTGGAFKNNVSLLSRRREIEELEEKEAAIYQDLEGMQQAIREGIAEERKNQELQEQNKRLLQENYILQNTEKIHFKRIQDEKIQKAEEYQAYVKESKGMEQQAAEICQNLQERKQQLNWHEQENSRLETEILQITKEAEEQRKNEGEQGRLLETLHMEYSSGQQKAAFIFENISRIQREEQKLTEERVSFIGQKEQTISVIQEKEMQMKVTEKNMVEAKDQAEIKKAALERANGEREKLAEKQRVMIRAREELTEQILALEKENFRLQNQKEKLEENLIQSVNFIWDEYELTQSEAAVFWEETEMGLSERKRRIASLKTQIRNLGAVNVNAIEDFKEVSERYLFLKGQHQDLTDSEETLLKIIEELDRGMRRQFLEKFEAIRTEFNLVFQELFGGGTGTLSLVEDEDILEAGIRVISQPPGKKLQNMMQLSGGEKALTAIALLFAIQNLKPSPFCLLDEIEAALDDSNVGRYADYLHKLTKYTQFIVITHRKGTMTASDRLYGITMQEKGVSALVSVDLVEKEVAL